MRPIEIDPETTLSLCIPAIGYLNQQNVKLKIQRTGGKQFVQYPATVIASDNVCFQLDDELLNLKPGRYDGIITADNNCRVCVPLLVPRNCGLVPLAKPTVINTPQNECEAC